MNDAIKMQISAFIDGELPENEAELLLRRLNQDAALRQQVAAYLAIGRYMRRDAELPGMEALRAKIASALGEEVLPAAPAVALPRSRFFKPAIGFAVAASVAVLAVVGLRESVVLLSPGASIASDGVVETAAAPAITQAAADDAMSEELRHMYLLHSTNSGDFGTNGIITRLVTLELQGGELVKVEPDDSAAEPVVAGHPSQEEAPLDKLPDGTAVDGASQAE